MMFLEMTKIRFGGEQQIIWGEIRNNSIYPCLTLIQDCFFLNPGGGGSPELLIQCCAIRREGTGHHMRRMPPDIPAATTWMTMSSGNLVGDKRGDGDKWKLDPGGVGQEGA